MTARSSGPARLADAAHAARPVHRWAALVVLCVSLLIVSLDNTVLTVALPTLVRDLGATSSQLQWVVDSYGLVFGGLLLVAGSSADRFGRKRTFLTGVGLFAAASTWAAFSGSVSVLIAARASMGIGAALIMPSTLSIITDMFREPGVRQRAISAWAATTGIGIAVGPIVAGLLLARFWWGSVFLINVPIAALGVAFALPLVPESRTATPRPADPVGAAGSIAGLGLLLWAIIEAPSHGWTSPVVLITGAAGLVALAGFVLWERGSDHPMLPLGLFRRRRFWAATTTSGLNMFALFGAMFVLTQFLQFHLGYTALQAGVRILPVAAVLAVAAPLSAVLVRFAGTKVAVVAGLVSITTGMWDLSTASAASTYADSLPGMILLGLGAGLVMPAAAESVMGSLPRGQTGVGAAMNGTSIQVGGALGVAVIGSLLSTRYQDVLTAPLGLLRLPATAADAALGSIGGALEVAARIGGPAARALTDLAHHAFTSGMHTGLLVGACVTTAAAVLALIALPSRPRPSDAAETVDDRNATGKPVDAGRRAGQSR